MECLKMNSLISFAGPITFKNARQAPECIEACPIDRIITETDSPYLAPIPHRGQRNEPAFVVNTAEVLANLKKMDIEELAQVTTNNFLTLFSKARIHD